MQLVSTLVAGIRGAENGTVQIFRRATSTRAVFYSDFIGTVHPNSGFDVTLDANGGTVLYVNELVDVRVFDVDGSAVRTFVEGESAPAVEAISQSFTGVDYTTSASGVGKPTNLQTVLDAVLTSFGATDWNVLFNGSSVTLQNALGSIAGVFINVKSPEFGALGNGVADDTLAIQNALDAAEPLAAIVLFPAGTYRLTDKLDVPNGVSLWGLGAQASILTIDDPAAGILGYATSSSTWYQEVRGLSLVTSQTNSGHLINLATGFRLVSVVNCEVGNSTHTSGSVVRCAAGRVLLDKSSFYLHTTGGIDCDNANATLIMRGCYVISASSTYNGAMVLLRSGTISDNILVSTATAGTYQVIKMNQGPQVTLNGNTLSMSAGASVGTAMQINNGNVATTCVIESGNAILNLGALNNYPIARNGFIAGSNNPQIQTMSRDSVVVTIVSDAATVDTAGFQYGTVWIRRDGAGAGQTLTSLVPPPGATLTIVVWNNSGGALGGNVTFGSGFYAGSPVITGALLPTNGKVTVCDFRALVDSGGNTALYPTGVYQGNI